MAANLAGVAVRGMVVSGLKEALNTSLGSVQVGFAAHERDSSGI
jgi:hypothetical protein